jgi:methylmalonyl-CoA/ethylmalonyl-CoA epimerase
MPEFRLEHVAISVSDLDRAVAWYAAAFGFDEVARSGKPALQVRAALLRLGGNLLELFEPYEPLPLPDGEDTLHTALRRLGTKHIAIAVDDIHEAYAHLQSIGAEFDTEVTAGSTSCFFFCKDPDGILIEVIQRTR